MKCGKCKETGVDLNHVRGCYGVAASTGSAPPARPLETGQHRATQPGQGPVGTLAPPALSRPAQGTTGPLENKDSGYYGRNRPLPFPAGRYAIQVGGDDAMSYSAVDRQDLIPFREPKVEFYQIDSPTEGRWAGYVFVKMQVSDDLYPVKRPKSISVIEAIAKDPKEAMLRYGREIGSCGHCGRTLTNEESRALGIGPICRGKMSW